MRSCRTLTSRALIIHSGNEKTSLLPTRLCEWTIAATPPQLAGTIPANEVYLKGISLPADAEYVLSPGGIKSHRAKSTGPLPREPGCFVREAVVNRSKSTHPNKKCKTGNRRIFWRRNSGRYGLPTYQ
jgi:hypothetical protein